MKDGKTISLGVGLLELMLVLAVAAVMLIVSVQYYRNAKTSQEVTTLVNSFNTLKSAVEAYLSDNPSLTSIPSVLDLYNGGYLPSAYSLQKNTWRGQIAITAATTTGFFKISQANVPSAVCTQAFAQLQATLNTTMGESIIAPKASNKCSDFIPITLQYAQ